VSAERPFAVSVAARAPVLGVVGLRGRAPELAATLHGRSLASLLPDVPLAATGSTRIHFQRGDA
jgi:hypothetical protein